MTDNLASLYKDQDIYVKFYVNTRSLLLKLDYYLEFLPIKGVIVDVGCGYGVLANYLSLHIPGSNIIGIDLNQKRIAAANKTIGLRENISFQSVDATQWDWPVCTGMAMTDFLHHLPPHNQEQILVKSSKSLADNGVLLISEVDTTAKPAYRYWASYMSDRVLYPLSKSHFRAPSEWENILSKLGFSINTVRLKNPIFAGVLFICRKQG